MDAPVPPWLAGQFRQQGQQGIPGYGIGQLQLTSAPADGQTTNVYADHFGHRDVAKPQQGLPLQTRRTFYTLEDSREFQKEFQTDIFGLVITNQAWINAFLFPLNFSQDLVTTVSSIDVNNPLQREIPILGIPPIMHRIETRRSYAALRYGIASFFELTRLETAEGQRDFMIAMAQTAGG